MRKRFSVTRRGFVGGLCATFVAPRFGACRADVPSGAPLARLGCGDLYARAWERCFHEAYRPIWQKTVKGTRPSQELLAFAAGSP